jgi:periplasmic copper chaperone A
MRSRGAWLAAVALLLPGVEGSVPDAMSEGRIVVQDAWARAVPAVATSGEFYMIIVNQGTTPDRLVAVRSPACGKLEPFEYYKGDRGMMGMRPLPGGALEVPPGRVQLQAGGFHLMCMGKRGDLRAGARVPLTLRFRDAGEVQVTIDIRGE